MLKTMKKFCFSIVFLLTVAPILRAENAGVPAECEDVMLQAFYWDSHQLTKYGRTKWVDLLADTAAINANFDLVWFPPSASSTGGVGYYHACLSNQESAWGQKSKLQSLISALHKGGTKVLGDVVINHRGNKSSWCDFYEDDFTILYGGKFQLTVEHICSGDECFKTTESSCYGSTVKGNADTGTNDAGARDLDHKSEYVQKWAKAYLKWMKNYMRYDGFRYDMTRGYAGSYLKMYNEDSQPYLSVSEYWMDDVTSQINHLKATDYNTMVFDFSQRSSVNSALKAGNYRLLVNPSNSFRGKGYSRYAVTFIDNHDTFERSDNQGGEFLGYNIDLQNPTYKNKILQANAYILMLPGVPCVFWPHWKSYPDEINALIALRKKAGIHSESAILSEMSNSNNVYEVQVQGHRGVLIMRLGANRSKEAPEGYYTAIEGGDVAAYTIFAQNGTGIEEVRGNGLRTKGEKFVKDGKLFIRVGETVYDVLGNRVE